jgi:hypothetical protein
MGQLLLGGVWNKNESQLDASAGHVPRSFAGKKTGKRRHADQESDGPGGSRQRLSQLLRDDDDDSIQPNIGGFVATTTTERPAVPRWRQGRTVGPADDELLRESKQ